MKIGDEVLIIDGVKKHFVGIIKDIKKCCVTVILHHKGEVIETCLNNIKLYKK